MKRVIHFLQSQIRARFSPQSKAETQLKEGILKKQSSDTNRLSRIEIDIPFSTLLKVFFSIAGFFLLTQTFFLLQDIVVVTLICFFLAVGLTPFVDSLEKRKIPRVLAIFILYILFLGSMGILFVSVLPVIIEQLTSAVRYFGGTNSPLFQELQKLDTLGIGVAISGEQGFSSMHQMPDIFSRAQEFFQSTFSLLSRVFQGIFNFLYALVLLFFILLERERLATSLLSFFPEKDRSYILQKTVRIQEKMKSWFRGQIILMFSVGIFMYIGMKIFEFAFGMQYAGTIAIVAGFMELFPYIGVTITGILAFLVAVNVSWGLVVAVFFWIALTQFLEGNLLVPIVMEKVTGLSSVVVMLALSIGGILGNAIGGIPMAILGMIFAIPVAASIAIFLEEHFSKENSRKIRPKS